MPRVLRFVPLLLLSISIIGHTQVASEAPLLPPATHYDIGRYLNIRSAYAPAVSPKGDEVVYLTNVTGTNQIWKNQLNGGYPEQLTFFDDRIAGVYWSPRGDVILFSKDSGGNERWQLYLTDPNGQTILPLTTNEKAIYSFGDFSRDGKWICYSSNEREDRFFDVYVMELATRKARRIATATTANLNAMSFSPDGRWVLASRERSNVDNDLLLIDVANGAIVELTPHQGDAFYQDSAWLPDSSGFYFFTNQDRDKSALAFMDVRAKTMRIIDASDKEIDDGTGVRIDPAGNFLMYAWNDNGASSIRIRDLKANKVYGDPMRGPFQGVAGPGSFTANGGKVVFSYSAPNLNSEVFVLPLNPKGDARQITHSTRAGIPAASFVKPSMITYKSFDGRMIPAFLYLPNHVPAGQKLPAIISVHGGPEAQEQAYFSSLYQYFLNRGYAILAPNIRGSAGFGKEYIHADDYKKRLDAIQDVAEANAYLRSRDDIDPNKIVVFGGSYGGFMVLAQMTMKPDIWAAGVDIVGIANWRTFFKNTGAWRRANRAAEYGDPEKDPAFMDSISPINFVQNIKAPLFIIAGANDPRVPKEEADQMAAAVKARGVPVEYISFPDEGHGMAKRANRIKGYTAVADFLDQYVKEKK